MTHPVPMPAAFMIPPLTSKRERQTPPKERHADTPKGTILHLPVHLTAGRRHSLAAVTAGQALKMLKRKQITEAFTLAERAAMDSRALICDFPRKFEKTWKVTYSDTHTKAVHILLNIADMATKKGNRGLAGQSLYAARKASFYLSPLYNLCEAKIAHYEGRPFRPDPAFPIAEDKKLAF